MVKRPFSAWECLSVGSFQIIGDVIAFKRISAMACFFGPFLTVLTCQAKDYKNLILSNMPASSYEGSLVMARGRMRE